MESKKEISRGQRYRVVAMILSVIIHIGLALAIIHLSSEKKQVDHIENDTTSTISERT